MHRQVMDTEIHNLSLRGAALPQVTLRVKAEKHGILASGNYKKCPEKVNEGRRQGRVFERNM